jgi:hypothetical protein
LPSQKRRGCGWGLFLDNRLFYLTKDYGKIYVVLLERMMFHLMKHRGIQLDTNVVTFRIATEQDLDKMVHMLSDDVLGNLRERYEQPLPENYGKAFQAINSDPK